MLPHQGSAQSSSFPFPGIGDLIAGRYRIERKVGTGGMGIVVAALDEQMGTRVAIKLLRPEEPELAAPFRRAEESGVVDRSSKHEQLSTRLIREASAASRLSSAHVTRVLDVGRLEGGDPFVVMELLEGVDLHRHVKSRGPLPIHEAVSLVLQACEAIFEAHELGIVHRDLKPANLFLTHRADGSTFVKVLDFGISKVLGADDDSQLTQTTDMLGSPLYMAPEQIRNARDVDGRADVWSLGTILYRLLAGRAAFEAQGSAATLAAIISDAPAPLRQVRPDVPPDLEAIILGCLEKDRGRRIQTVRQLAIALQRFAVAQSSSMLHEVQLPPAAPGTGSFSSASTAPSTGSFSSASTAPSTGSFSSTAPSTGSFSSTSVPPNAVTLDAPGKPSRKLIAALAVLFVTLVAGVLTAWWVLVDSNRPVQAKGAAAPASAAPSEAPSPAPPVASAAPSTTATAAPSATATADVLPASAAVTSASAPATSASAPAKATSNHTSPVQVHAKPSDDPLGDRL